MVGNCRQTQRENGVRRMTVKTAETVKHIALGPTEWCDRVTRSKEMPGLAEVAKGAAAGSANKCFALQRARELEWCHAAAPWAGVLLRSR